MYCLLTCFLGVFLAFSPAYAQFAQPTLRGDEAFFEALGDLPGGAFSSTARSVSADGSVVVGYSVSAKGMQAYRWREGEMEGLGYLPTTTVFSEAFGVSADGSIVAGYSGHSTPQGGNEAFLWEGGEMEGLGDLPGGHVGSAGLGVSPDGVAVVGSSWSGTHDGREAFRWLDGELEALGFLPGGTTSYAEDASNGGAVVVGYGSSESGSRAFLWSEEGGMDYVGDLPGGSLNSSAYAVSPNGSTVVGYSNSENGNEAFRWQAGEMLGLGDIPGGAFASFAHGVSADGSVVVGVSLANNGNEAFIWREGAGMRALKEVLEQDHGLDLGTWRLRFAFDVSHDGTVIVGVGTNPEGKVEAFRAFLPFTVDGEAPPRTNPAALGPPIPNPTRGSSSLTLRVADAQHVRIEAFDTTGRRVRLLYEGLVQAGASRALTFDASALPTGTYVVRVTGEEGVMSQSVTVVK